MLPAIEPLEPAAGAAEIIDGGLWCVMEVCVDVPEQSWEPRLLICHTDVDVVIATVAEWVAQSPGLDVRLAGYRRDTLERVTAAPTVLCHLGETASLPVESVEDPPRRRLAVLVREGMNEILVTVGPEHTLREAARRMHARGVGAAVVLDAEQHAPGIITERDLLAAAGQGLDLETELVRDHVSSQLIYAAPDWTLEHAAEEMTRGRFRHVIVLEGPEVVGILSMRDIVRCWVSDGASCDSPRAAAGG